MTELLSIYWRHFRQLRRQPDYPVLQEGVFYHCPLSLRKRHNLALQQIHRPLLAQTDLALPHVLTVGVTTACNLRCPACPTGTKALGRPTAHLDFEVYARAVDQLRGALLMANFWDWGEPFLHPRLADMIAHAARSGVRTVTSTNGTVGNSPAQIERIVRSGLDLLIICVDGLTQETHEKYRVGGRLDEVLRTLDRVVDTRERLGLDRPVVEMRTLATRYNQDQLPGLLDLARDRGAHLYSVKSLRPFDYRGHDVDGELVPLDPRLARYETPGQWRNPSGPRPPLRCAKPLYAPTINSDGRLVFCYYAGYEEESFGDLRDGGFRRVWNSPSARRKRLEFLSRQGTRTCDDCFFRSDHKPCVFHTVALRPLPPGLSLQNPRTPEQFLADVARRPLCEEVAS